MSTNQDGDETKSGERFAHRFETQKAGIEKLIDQVKDNTSIVTERGNVINQCFMGIARLSDDVGDASRYTTAYEQRLYSQVDGNSSWTGPSHSDLILERRQLIR